MAALSRSERQLMRQRGAGERDISDVEFGIDFTAQGGRDGRLLMRQRGAGNRHIETVDFGLGFLPTSQSRRSTSRTPRRSGKGRGSKVRDTTDARPRRESSAARSSRAASIAPKSLHLSEASPALGLNQPTDTNGASAKRRRLNGGVPTPSAQRRRSSGAVFTVLEVPEQQSYASARDGVQASQPSSPMFFTDDHEKENQGVYTSQMDRNTEKLPHQNASRLDAHSRKTRSSVILAGEITSSSIESDGIHIESSQGVEHPTKFSEDGRVSLSQSTSLNEGYQPSSTTLSSRKRRKRKSVVLGRKKRRSSEKSSSITPGLVDEPLSEDEPGTGLTRQTQEIVQRRIPNIEQENEPESVAEVVLRRRDRKHRGRSNPLSVSVSPAPDTGDGEDDESYVDEAHTTEPLTPAPKRKAGSNRAETAAAANVGDVTTRKTSKSSFPILTHRMTNGHQLPTIVEEDETSVVRDPEDVGLPAMLKGRNMPNAVDVLAQICRETVETAIEQLEGDPAVEARKHIPTKRKALEAFSHELDQRLFNMSETVEYRMTLETRLRKARREKADMQARWLQLRRQRDELALRADDVRRQNWENEEHARQRWQASELAHTTEMQLETESPSVGLEFLLRKVAGIVSDATSGPGLLGYIKGFNVQLERLAAGLEGRS